MSFFYNIGIIFYSVLIRIASLFNGKARKWIRGRKNIFRLIEKQVNPSEKIIWFHAASLGEFEQGRPIIEAFRAQFPEYKILLTFFSPSGYEIRKNYDKADYIFYLPIDVKRNAKKFIKLTNPRLAIFIKYEFWFNYINELTNRNIPVFIVSAIFRKEQHFFRWYGSWSRNMLKKLSEIFVQNKNSFDLLKLIDINNVLISGDTRFDRVYSILKQNKEYPTVKTFIHQSKVILGGSTWGPDETLLKNLLHNIRDFKLIIAPHEVSEDRIDSIMLLYKDYNPVRFTKTNQQEVSTSKVLIIDTIGILSGLYQYCDIAFIGGGFGKGIHNILEAVTFGKPVCFGPNYHKFDEAVNLIKIGGAFPIETDNDLNNTVQKLFDTEEYYTVVSELCKSYIDQNRGATSIITDKLRGYLN